MRHWLEPLEDRSVPTIISWAADNSGFWDDAANWSPQQIPGQNDDVIINRGAANPTVTIRDNRTVHTLAGTEALSISAGTFEIAAASQFDGALIIAGGTLRSTVALTLTSNSHSDWQSGVINLTGPGLLNNGTITLTGNGVKQLYGPITVGNGGSFIQQGTASFDLVGSPASLELLAGGTYDIQSDGDTSSGDIIVNTGATLRKSAGAGESLLASKVSLRGGTVDVESGKLTFASQGAVSTGGNFTVNTGAILDLTGGTNITYSGTFTGSGLGRVEFNSGFISTDVPGLTLNFAPGLFQWTGGAFGSHASRPINDLGQITLSGSGVKQLYGPIFVQNGGTVLQTGTGSFDLVGSPASLEIQSGGLYDFQSDADTNFGDFVVNTGGTLRKSVGSGESLLSSKVNLRGGTVDVQTGKLTFAGQGSYSTGANFTVSAGATVDLTGGATITYTGTFTGSGAGKVEFSVGSINTDVPGINLNFAPGVFQWTGGAFGSHSSRPVNVAGQITLSGANVKQLYGPIFIQNGASIVQKGTGSFDLVGSPASIEMESGGIYDFQSDADTNFGDFNIKPGAILRKSAGNGESRLASRVNLIGGSIDVQIGKLTIAGGNSGSTGGMMNVAGGATLDLTGGANAVFYSGIFVGTGTGVVQLTDGELRTYNAGATFNFPANMFQWDGGAIVGGNVNPFINAGVITINGASDKAVYGNLVNQGLLTHTAGAILGNGNIYNEVGAVYDFNADGGSDTYNLLINRGTLRKSAGAGIATIDTRLRSEKGTIEVKSGTLKLTRGGYWMGIDIHADAGADLQMAGDIGYTVSGDIVGSGAGHINFNGPNIYTIVNDDFNYVTLNFVGDFFQWKSGSFSGGGAFGGGGEGGIGSPVTNLGTINITGPDAKSLVSATIINQGTIIDSGTGDLAMQGNVIDNRAGGTFEIRGDGDLIATGVFKNAGQLIKTAGTGRSKLDVSVNLEPSSVIRVETGTMEITGSNGWKGGVFNIFAGATFEVSGNIGEGSGALTGIGAGTFNYHGIFGGNGENIPVFNFPAGMFKWTMGQLSGRIINNGEITIDSSEAVFSRAYITNNGTFVHQGSFNYALNPDCVFENNGVYEFRSDADVYVTPSASFGTVQFKNTGVIRKTGGTGVSEIRDDAGPGQDLRLDNTGTVEVLTGTISIQNQIVQSSGTTLTGGTWKVGPGATLAMPGASNFTTNKGTVILDGPGSTFTNINSLTTNQGTFAILNDHDFTVNGNFTNNGVLEVGKQSTLSVNGNFTQAAGTQAAMLQLDVGGDPSTGKFGNINVTGVANLSGRLHAETIDGYGPAVGQQYTVGNFASRVGNFSLITSSAGRAPLFDVVVGNSSIVFSGIGNAGDLTALTVSGPASVVVGQPIAVNYSVKNSSTEIAEGTWSDSFYFSRDAIYSPDDVLIGRVAQNRTVNPSASYSGVLNANSPIAIDGDYYVILVVDSRAEVRDTNRLNNVLASNSKVTVSVPVLNLTGQINGTIATGQDLLFRTSVAAGQDIRFLTDMQVGNEADVYVSRARFPTIGSYDLSATENTQLHRSIALDAAVAGDYYVLIHGREGAGAGAGFTLLARALASGIESIDQTHGSNLGAVTITVHGSDFTPNATVQLIDGATTRTATTVRYRDSNTLWATFSLAGLAPTAYDVQVLDDSGASSLSNVFTVNTGAVGKIDITQESAATMRAGRDGKFTIEYRNIGETDVPAPIILLTSDNASLKLPSQLEYLGSQYEIFGANFNGPAGILPPGAVGRVTVDFRPINVGPHVAVGFTARVATNSTTITWNDLKSEYKPLGTPTDAWDVVYANFVAAMGNTTAQYEQVLRADANYLSQLGEYTNDIGQLLQYEFLKADAYGNIIPRYLSGPMGRGQGDPLVERVTTDSSGNIAVTLDGQVRHFLRNADGTYQSFAPDYGVMTKLPSGTFVLTEVSGEKTVFRTDGLFDYRQDLNGNRVTASYSGSKLTSLFDSATNDTTSFAYNAANRISQIVDPVGRITTLTYDASGEHLISVATPQGTTTFTYVTGQGAAREHAVSTVQFADGTIRNYTYDAKGRVTRITKNGGAEPYDFTYDADGGISIRDGLNNVTRIFLDESGFISRLIDPRGNIYNETFQNGLDIGLVNPDGARYDMSRDAIGNLTSILNPIGSVTTLKYLAGSNRVSSLTNPNGNTTTFTYDSHGNITGIADAGGSQVSYSYDLRGNQTVTVDADGRTTNFTYDSHGLLIQRRLDDNTVFDYTYDSHRNITQIRETTPALVIKVTVYQYDNSDRVTKVVDAEGRSIDYTYDNFGRRSRMQTNDGFVINYVYDTVGRLSQIKDGANQALVTYTYDTAGRLSREDRANGIRTEYAYDATGNVILMTHRAPNNQIQQQFAYTYDSIGQRLTMTTTEGTTNYSYDASGQLKRVVLPNGRQIEYTYDAQGNRISVADTPMGGPTTITPYSTNSVDQYTTVGNASYIYDDAGNVITRTDSLGTTTYGYDASKRLISMTGPTDTWAYEYDSFGQRTAVTHNGVRTEYLIDPFGLGNVIGEYQSNGSLIAHFAYGNGLETRIDDSSAQQFYQFDILGSATALTDASGAMLNTYSYLPFGERLTSTGTTANPFTFVAATGVMDSGDGLYYMRNRYYDSKIGRFTQEDPTGFAAGDTSLYRYALNNPTHFIDPQGLQGSPPPAGGGDTSLVSGLRDAVAPGLNDRNNLVNDPTNFYPAYRPGPNRPEDDDSPPQPILPWITPTPLPRPLKDTKNFKHNVDEYTRRRIQAYTHDRIKELTDAGHPPTPSDIKIIVDAAEKVYDDWHTEQLTSNDPNDITGPSGGGPKHGIQTDSLLPYVIRFENKATADLPASDVRVTMTLDPNLDWSTFELGDIGFGAATITIPQGMQTFATRFDDRSQSGLFVDITASVNLNTGVVEWLFHSIDPNTGDVPEDPTAGFLPANIIAGQGEGFVGYRIRTKDGVAHNTRIEAKADIRFDVNDIIPTPVWFNTVDTDIPTSNVLPLATAVPTTTFTVKWIGSEPQNGSGVASYDIYVKEDSGAYTLWLSDTTLTQAQFTGQNGKTYSFYSVATDYAGNVEADPLTPDATTTVNTSLFVYVDDQQTLIINGSETADQITLSDQGGVLTVVRNGQTWGSLTGATKVRVNLLGGNDNFAVVGTTNLNITVDGGAGSDTVATSNGNDSLIGGADNDFLFGLGGNDVIFGGDGNDGLDGGDNNDTVSGDNGSDYIVGGNGNDSLVGGADNDGFDAGAGDDLVDGGLGNDFMYGFAGNDTLRGSDGNDGIDAGAGNDFVDGGNGDDFMYGLDGNDTLLGQAGNDGMDGGLGNDSMLGGIGNDLLFGAGGDDFVSGQAGNDSMNGDAGNDSLDGGSEDDLIFSSGGGIDIVFGGTGNDTLQNIDSNCTIFGGAGNDVLYGANFLNDSLVGDDGNDTFFGLSGNDTVTTGAGNDTVDGGAGTDFVTDAQAGDVLFNVP